MLIRFALSLHYSHVRPIKLKVNAARIEMPASNKFDPAPLVREFPPEQQKTAEQLALIFAVLIRSSPSQLRPETNLDEIFEWCTPGIESAELIMALEEEMGCEIPDHLATFRDLVAHITQQTEN